MADDLSIFIPKVNFEQIPIKNLVSNQEYQRNLSASHIRHTAENFDLYQINPVKVSRRGGINYVFNGQHTIEIVAIVSGSRDTPVWCMVYDELDYKEEADIFANQQKYVRSLTSYEIFKANVEAGNDEELLIKSLVESYNMRISHNKLPGTVTAVATLGFIYKKYGYHVLDRALRLCIGAWEGDMNSLTSCVLKGIALLIFAFGDDLRDDLFQEKVGGMPLKDIGRMAKELEGGVIGYAEAMLVAYNKKMKYPLQRSELFVKRKSDKQDEIKMSENAGVIAEENDDE
jgi:hypothetical protein